MKKHQEVKFLFIFTIFFFIIQVEAKRNCKPGQEDVIFQPFDLIAQGMSRIFFTKPLPFWAKIAIAVLITLTSYIQFKLNYEGGNSRKSFLKRRATRLSKGRSDFCSVFQKRARLGQPPNDLMTYVWC
jgi:hypothetical protein